MEEIKPLGLTERQRQEIEEVKKKYDEYKLFKKLNNKPDRLVMDIEEMKENLKRIGGKKYVSLELYQG